MNTPIDTIVHIISGDNTPLRRRLLEYVNHVYLNAMVEVGFGEKEHFYELELIIMNDKRRRAINSIADFDSYDVRQVAKLLHTLEAPTIDGKKLTTNDAFILGKLYLLNEKLDALLDVSEENIPETREYEAKLTEAFKAFLNTIQKEILDISEGTKKTAEVFLQEFIEETRRELRESTEPTRGEHRK